MTRNPTARKPGQTSKTLNRLPYLANPLLRFNLPDELLQLRNEDSWQRETGRSSRRSPSTQTSGSSWSS